MNICCSLPNSRKTQRRLHRPRLISAVAMLLMLVMVGCHPMRTRSAARSNDDWETPQNTNYALPRRFSRSEPKSTPKSAKSNDQPVSRYLAKQPPAARNELSKAELSKAEAPKAEAPRAGAPPNSPTAAYNNAANRAAQAKAAAAIQRSPDSPTTKKAASAPITQSIAATTKPATAMPQSSDLKPTATAIQSTDPLATPDQELDFESALAVLPTELQQVFREQMVATKLHQQQSVTSNDTVVKPASGVTETASKPVRVSISDRQLSAEPQHAAIEPAVTQNNINEQFPVALASATMPVSLDKSNEAITPTDPLATTLGESANQRDWQTSLQIAADKLHETLDTDQALQPQLRLHYELALRMIHLASNNLEKAMEPIRNLSATEQDYYRHQLQALYESGNPDAAPVASRRWSSVMNAQRQATGHLANLSSLEVRNAAFCTDVQGYGNVTPFKSKVFRPDQDVLLYCELENVTSDEIANGYETQVQGNYQIFDKTGNRIAEQLLPMEKEICQNHRRDYFVVYRIFMPMQIVAGDFEMRITVEDMKGKKFGQSDLEFSIQ